MSKPKKQEKPYNYFDTPDGEDTVKKLWCVTKPAGLASLAIATVDVMLYSHPKGYLATLGRYAYICLPLIGMSTAFVLTTNLATNIRKKEDKVNWVLGACAAGGIFGAWRRSTPAGFAAAAGFSIAAALKKEAVQQGWTVLPTEFKQAHGGLRAGKHDYTLTRYIPGNWTTGKDC